MTSEVEHNHVLIIEDDKGRREFELNKPIYRLGRDPKCDIRLSSQFVSRLHATLIQLPQPDGRFFYRIVDGSIDGKPSSNGILINGRKVQTWDLKNSDEVVFGPKVSAIYYALRKAKDPRLTIPDEFDITLISPNMVEEEADLDDNLDSLFQKTPSDLGLPTSLSSASPLSELPIIIDDDDDDMRTQSF